MATYAREEALVDTQWVADHLKDPKVRVMDVPSFFLWVGGPPAAPSLWLSSPVRPFNSRRLSGWTVSPVSNTTVQV